MRLSQRYYDKPNEGAGTPPVIQPMEPVVPPVVVAPIEPVVPPVTPPVEPPKVKDWKDDRIAKLTHDLNEARRTAANPPPPPVQKPGEDAVAFQTRVDEAANTKAVQIAAQADWDRQCNDVAAQGKKEFPDFDARLAAITSTINGQDVGEVQAYNEVLAAAIETGEAHKVLYALGSDPGEYQKLMKLSPVKRAMELGKMAVALVNDKEPSKLPKPITPLQSGGEHYEGISPDDPKRGGKLPTKEWMKLREAQARERGIQ